MTDDIVLQATPVHQVCQHHKRPQTLSMPMPSRPSWLRCQALPILVHGLAARPTTLTCTLSPTQQCWRLFHLVGTAETAELLCQKGGSNTDWQGLYRWTVFVIEAASLPLLCFLSCFCILCSLCLSHVSMVNGDIRS